MAKMQPISIACVRGILDLNCAGHSLQAQNDIGFLSSSSRRRRKSYLYAQCKSNSKGPQGTIHTRFTPHFSNTQKKCISQVIVITHSHADRVGVRWLLPALKVYYIPFLPIASSATLPNFFTSLPYIRTILLREHIRLIHAHASLSSMGHEGILHSHLMGIRTVFTDHSLFGFDDAASILTNKLMVGTLKNVDAIICVSHTGSVFFFPLRSIDRERYIFFFVVERTPCFVVSSSNEARRTQLALKFEKTSM